jgi:MFS family permease
VSSSPPSVTRVALLLGTLVALTVIGSSAVAVALPEVAADLGLDKPGTAWVLAVFSLAFSVTTAVFGRLADLKGLRFPLVLGVGLLAAGSVLAAVAWSFPSLMFARMVQGAGAGAVPVLALGVIAARYEGVARGRALGGLTAVVSLVSGSGPLIGGGITQLLGWRFVLAVPAIALLILMPVARLASDRPTAQGRIDWRGAGLVGLLTSGVVLLLQSPATRAGPLLVIAAAAAGLLGAGGLWHHVRQRPEGLLPRRVVADVNVMVTALAGMTLLAAYFGMILALPLILSAEQGWTPLQIGSAMLPAALVGAVSSRVVGGSAQRLGRHRVAAWLAAGSGAGLLLAAAGHAEPILLIVGFAAVVTGFAAGQVPLVDSIAAMVDPDVQGGALGVFNLTFFTGGAVGSAIIGGIGGATSLPLALACLALLPLAGAAGAVSIGRRLRHAARPGDAEPQDHGYAGGLHHQA